MKLKQQPEDFQVEELTDAVAGADGPYTFYRLTKTGWTTPDALAAVRRRWQIDQRRLSYGGLKDRHAQTTQFFSIFRGPQRNLTHHKIHVEYLGRLPEEFTAAQVRANRFRITLRAMTDGQVRHAEQAAEEVRREGLPNYFDDQRFGSVSPGGNFIAREIVLGRHEEALKLALAARYEFDRAEQKREKAILRECWGDWARCKQQLPRGHARSLADYLAQHPDDYRGAVERLRPDLRGLYLSAYQSHLWNRMLARWLRDHLHPTQWLALDLRLEEAPVPRGLAPEQLTQLADLQLPLPSPRQALVPGDARATYLEAVLQEEGITLEQMKLKKFRKMFFSRGERAAWYFPENLRYNASTDERQAPRLKLELAFDLPRGSYATLIVKRLTAVRPLTPAAP
jgi:tRNA pseudouridine13 synthase